MRVRPESNAIAPVCSISSAKQDLKQSRLPVTKNRKQGRLFLELVSDPGLILDRRLHVVFANPPFYKLTGFASQETIRKSFNSLFQTVETDLVQVLRRDKKACFDVEFKTKENSTLHIHFSCTTLPNKNASFGGAIVLLIDITQKIVAYNSILAAKIEWEKSFDVIKDFIFIVDKNNIIKRANISISNHLNVHPNDLIGKNCDNIFDFSLKRLTRTSATSLLSTGKSIKREIYSYKLEGYYQVNVHPFFNPMNNDQGFVYVLHDLKSQKRWQNLLLNAHNSSEKKIEKMTGDLRKANKDLLAHLRDKEAIQNERIQLAAIIEQVGEGVVLTDTNWTINYVNPAFSKITGISREKAVSEKLNFLHTIQCSLSTQEKMQGLFAIKEVWQGRSVKYRDDGTRYDVKVQISPLKNQDGAIVNYFGMLSDVTQELRLERRIRSAEKMEVIGIFAAGIAHDFNNILGGITGSIELAENQLNPDDQARADLQEALRYTENAKQLINQILTFKHQYSLTVFPLKAASAMQEVLDFVRSLMPEGVRIVQNICLTEWMLLANITHLKQLMMNLCINAAHAMNNHGHIEVTLAEKKINTPQPVHDNHLPPGEYLHIKVKDTGHGIPRNIRESIFEPFFSTKKNTGGTGMGLPIVNAVVCRLGGGIYIESEQGLGTTIHVYLPRCNPDGDLGQNLA